MISHYQEPLNDNLISKNEIMNDNVLIAEFVGRRGKHNNQLFTFKGLYNLVDDTWCYDVDLKFNSSWDWFMIAAKKCRDITQSKYEKDDPTLFVMYDMMFRFVKSYSLKEAFDNLIEFIKYYNEKYNE